MEKLNVNPMVFPHGDVAKNAPLGRLNANHLKDEADYMPRDLVSAEEVYDAIRYVSDPEHPLTLEQLKVVTVREMYTMMKAIALVNELCQSTSLSGVTAMYCLLLLIQSDLNTTRRLEIRDAGQYFKPANRGSSHRQSTPPEPVYKEPKELSGVARKLALCSGKRCSSGLAKHVGEKTTAKKVTLITWSWSSIRRVANWPRSTTSQLQARAQFVIKYGREGK